MTPPRLADAILRRVLPIGKRGDSILGDLREEFRANPSALWYWRQRWLLSIRYLTSRSPYQDLTYPRSRGMWFELSSDLKAALRSMRRAPAASALIVLTLALAIGAATVGFVFVDLALLRGLPVDDTSRVVSVLMTDTNGSEGRGHVSGPDFLDYVARSTTLERIAVMRNGRAPLIRGGQSMTLTVALASAELFEAMGQRPMQGRGFLPGEDAAGATPVVVLAHRFWQSEFNGRPDVIGQTLQIGREHHTIVGIMSPDMEFGNIGEAEVWLPLRVDPAGPRDVRNLRLVARLKDGVSHEQAAAEMAAIGATLSIEHPRTNNGWLVRLVPVNDIVGGDEFWVVVALFALSIGLLMAIATANVSNMVMVRMLARARELAVRTALGARKGRLVRQLVAEGLALSVASALLAIPVAWAATRAIAALSPEAVFQQLHVDVHELTFVAVLTLICPVMFTLAPMRMLGRPDMRQVLAAGGGRGMTATSRGRTALVIMQVALAVVLLTVSVLSLRSMQRIYAAPTGMDTSRLLAFGLEFNDAQYPDAAAARSAADATRSALQRTSAVESVELVSGLPILGDSAPVVLSIDRHVPGPDDVRPTAVVTSATPGAGRALGLTMLSGTWWMEGASGVAVVSETAARRHLGGVDQAIGRMISVTQGTSLHELRVIGVVSDVANTNRTQAAPPRVWMPIAPGARRFAYLVETTDPAALTSNVRRAVAGEAPAIAVEYLQPFDSLLADAASSDYLVIGMLAGFAGLAVILASTGLFGVVSYTVARRTAEFGTRMALGASAGEVVRLVVRESAVILVVGLVAGLAGGVGIASLMGSVLAGLSPLDPLTISSVVTLLCLVTITATALPAWRASRIDPLIALRTE